MRNCESRAPERSTAKSCRPPALGELLGLLRDLGHENLGLLLGARGQAADGELGSAVAVDVRIEVLRGNAAELAVPAVQGGHEHLGGRAQVSPRVEGVVAQQERVARSAPPIGVGEKSAHCLRLDHARAVVVVDALENHHSCSQAFGLLSGGERVGRGTEGRGRDDQVVDGTRGQERVVGNDAHRLYGVA